jgi:GTP-binding protein EngB required for normal cell division
MNKTFTFASAISAIDRSIQVNIINDEYENIEWLNSQPIPKQTLLDKIEELKDEYNSKLYQRNRAKAYPSIQEQLDLQYWDKINNTDNWEQAINAVKAQYPKS